MLFMHAAYAINSNEKIHEVILSCGYDNCCICGQLQCKGMVIIVELSNQLGVVHNGLQFLHAIQRFFHAL